MSSGPPPMSIGPPTMSSVAPRATLTSPASERLAGFGAVNPKAAGGAAVSTGSAPPRAENTVPSSSWSASAVETWNDPGTSTTELGPNTDTPLADYSCP